MGCHCVTTEDCANKDIIIVTHKELELAIGRKLGDYTDAKQ